MDKLHSLKQSTVARAIVFLVLTHIAVGAGVYAIAKGYVPLDIKPEFLLAGFGTVVILIAILAGVSLAHQAFMPFELLTQAILHVSSQASLLSAPDMSKTGSARTLLEELASTIYDFASGTHQTHAAIPANTKAVSADEAMLKDLIDKVPVPLAALDEKQRVIFVNQAIEDYCQLHASEMIGRTIDDIFTFAFPSEDTLANWIGSRSNNAVKETRLWERVRTSSRAKPEINYIDLLAYYNQGNPHHLETILVFEDRTEKYAHDDQDVGFLAMAVHELRTPLTLMRGYIEVVDDEVGTALNTEQKLFLAKLQASERQLTAIVSNILNVARIEDNQMEVKLIKESWPEVLVGALQDMALRARVHKKKITYELQKDLPPVAIDRVSMYEVICNLVDNAIKYSPENSTVAIKSFIKDGMLATTVTDTGIGIPETVMGHIFDKFYRSHRSSSTVGGTGLGLYLSKALVSAQGGQIWVQSKEGQGSTFGFTVPLYDSVANELKAADNNGEITRGAHGWIKNHSLVRK